jgi:hypothetical protein
VNHSQNPSTALDGNTIRLEPGAIFVHNSKTNQDNDIIKIVSTEALGYSVEGLQ